MANGVSKSGAVAEHVNRQNERIQKTKPSKCKKGEFQRDKEKAVSQHWTKVKPLDLNFPQKPRSLLKCIRKTNLQAYGKSSMFIASTKWIHI